MSTRAVDGAEDIVARPHNDHAERLDLVDACVGRIERTRDLVESNLAVETRFEVPLQRVAHARQYRVASCHTEAVDTSCRFQGRPTNVPDRILRVMARPTIDHRGPECRTLTR